MRQLGIPFDGSPEFISLSQPPPCNRSICRLYLLRHGHLEECVQAAHPRAPLKMRAETRSSSAPCRIWHGFSVVHISRHQRAVHTLYKAGRWDQGQDSSLFSPSRPSYSEMGPSSRRIYKTEPASSPPFQIAQDAFKRAISVTGEGSSSDFGESQAFW